MHTSSARARKVATVAVPFILPVVSDLTSMDRTDESCTCPSMADLDADIFASELFMPAARGSLLDGRSYAATPVKTAAPRRSGLLGSR